MARKSLAGSQAEVNLLERDVFTVEPIPKTGCRVSTLLSGILPSFGSRSTRGIETICAQRSSTSGGTTERTGVFLGRDFSPRFALPQALRPTGHGAPAELLTVSYAAPVREWLRNRFRSVNIVLFDKLQFPGTQADVILLLAEGAGSCEAFSLWPVQDGAELEKIKPYSQVNVNPGASDKWGSLLVPRAVKEDLGALTGHEFQLLSDVADLRLGAVTGANSFFVMTDDERQAGT